MHGANSLFLSLIAAGVLAQAQSASDSVQSEASIASLDRTTIAVTGTRTPTEAQQPVIGGQAPDQRSQPLSTADKTAQLSGVAVDTSGALIAGVGVMIRSLDVAKLVASHDLRFLGEVTTRALVLADGRIIAGGETGAILADEGLFERAGLI